VRKRNSGTLSLLLNSDGVLGVVRLEGIEVTGSQHSGMSFRPEIWSLLKHACFDTGLLFHINWTPPYVIVSP